MVLCRHIEPVIKMEWSKLVTDTYERKARLYPVLLTFSPLVALAVAIFVDYLSLLESTGIVVLGSASVFFLAQIGRDYGKEGEKRLWQSWDGMPSMAIFRHRNVRLNPITKARYHQRLSQALRTRAPSPEEESADPIAADTIYATWSDYLRTNTRDGKFPLVLKENTNYGYRRNVWGLRPAGIASSIVGSTICALRLYFEFEQTNQIAVLAGIAGTYCFVLLVFWLFHFTANWVRIAADSYAERLVESVELLLRHEDARPPV